MNANHPTACAHVWEDVPDQRRWVKSACQKCGACSSLTAAQRRLFSEASETTDAPTPRETGAVTYAEKQEWAERHGISIAVGDVPTAFDDAATLWMTKARPDAASASVTEAMIGGEWDALKAPEMATWRKLADSSREWHLRFALRIAALAAAPRDAGREEVSDEEVITAMIAFQDTTDNPIIRQICAARIRLGDDFPQAIRRTIIAARRGATG